MATKKPNPFAKKKAPVKKGGGYEKGSGNNMSSDMMGEMAACMKKKGMTRAKCMKMMKSTGDM